MANIDPGKTVFIGTSGFSFPDWRGGVVYPKGLAQKEELVFYANELRFNCLEVNATYYAIISEKSAAAMEKKTGSSFEFVVKGFRGFTHDPFDPRMEDKPSFEKAMENAERFYSALKPFASAGKLGAILLQFPVFFTPSDRSKAYMVECRKRLGNTPVVIEFRNSGWATPETLDFLRAESLSYCAVDEPKLPRLMPFQPEVTGSVAYLRFHGRNQNWFNAPTSERYDYLYSKEELQEFLKPIEEMSKKADKIYIFFNNCHAGSAARNAADLKDLLGFE